MTTEGRDELRDALLWHWAASEVIGRYARNPWLRDTQHGYSANMMRIAAIRRVRKLLGVADD